MGIVRPIMEVHSWAWVFFVPFIFFSTFIIVNLIIAIVVDAMNEMNTSDEPEVIPAIVDNNELSVHTEIQNLRVAIEELKVLLKK